MVLNIKAALVVAADMGLCETKQRLASYGLWLCNTDKPSGMKVMVEAGFGLPTIVKLIKTAEETDMGEIGVPERFIEIEPIPETEPVHEPAPAEPVVPEKEPVPA